MIEYEYDEPRYEPQRQRGYRAALNAHPDCRDPDHPGCLRCEPDEDESDDDDA